MSDIERVIMPGVTHWHSPQFHAYFPTANSYPAIVGDILSDAIACIGFSWIARYQLLHYFITKIIESIIVLSELFIEYLIKTSNYSPACTELEMVMMDWLGKMLNLPQEFLFT